MAAVPLQAGSLGVRIPATVDERMERTMAPDEDRIAHIVETHGTTKQEARIIYHLDSARELINDLEPPEGWSIRNRVSVELNLRALYRLIGIRVLERNYPEGWGFIPQYEDEQEDEEEDQ
jgi:hypothetical protein